MTLKDQINKDLKESLLKGDNLRTDTLRALKNAILYTEVAQGAREEGLTDEVITKVLAKESKKRQESADLYKQSGENQRADKELQEKSIIDAYLPEALSEEKTVQLVEDAIAETGADSRRSMGKVIALVKAKSQGLADGATIAKLVKDRLPE